jgi:hypothetical protein
MNRRFPVLIIVLVLGFCPNISSAKISFAIFPLQAEGDISSDAKEWAESTLNSYLVRSGKYKIVGREDLEKIMAEHQILQGGLANLTESLRIGQLTLAEKLIMAKIYTINPQKIAIAINVIDVNNSQVEFTKERSGSNLEAEAIAKWIAADIIEEFPLLGKVIAVKKDDFIINLGRNDGLAIDSRLFVARKEVVSDDDGKVLFESYDRLGTLRVTKLAATRGLAQIESLENHSVRIEKNDLVSPNPIPKRETAISKSPLLPHVKEGELLLEDDMRSKKYLAPSHNKGKAYIGGKLHLNGTHRKFGHVWCFYPSPFDTLSNFIVEGEVGLQKSNISPTLFAVILRADPDYEYGNAYSLQWTNNGMFGLNKHRFGAGFKYTLESSSLINRGKSSNKFRIVAYDSKFDFYMNDEFLAGFTDESYEMGTIGFAAKFGTHYTVDNIKIWKAIQQKKQ